MEHVYTPEAAMGENEAMRRSLLVVTFTMDGIILEANPVFLKVMGYTLEEIKGKHHRLIVSSASVTSREYEEFWQRLNHGEFQAAEVKRIGKDGKEVWLWATYTPVLDASGKPFKVIKIATDMTEQKLRTAELEAQSHAIRRSQGVVTFSTDGTILDANSIFLNVMGYTLEEIQGKHHRLLVPSKYAASQEYVEFWARLNRGEFHTAECKRIAKGGREVWWQATYTPIVDLSGRVYKVVKFATDLTEQKRRLSELDRQKSMFLANMSHEIRTPMNGIFGMLSLLRDTPLDTAGSSYVDTCMRSAESLLTVLNDILLISKADAGAIQLERVPFNLNSIIEDVLHIVASNVNTAQDIDITYFIKPDVPLFLIGDSSRLRQVLLNLLSNAVKFTKYGEVSLDVSVHTRMPALMLKFDVSDTGIGISESDQARLFSPFTQVDPSVTRQHGGTGLGLSICRHLVTLFGGDISVQSRPGRGSTFSFTACFIEDPARVGQSLASALDMNEDTNFLRNLRVLIIDDNSTNCVALETMLQQFGCRVTSARSGMDGIDMLRAGSMQGEAIDLLLLDYHMPHMSGVDVARAIARLGLTPRIIALGSNVDAKLAMESNILAFSAKPVRRGQLLHMIRSVMVGPSMQSSVRVSSSPLVASRRGPQMEPGEAEVEEDLAEKLTGICVLLVEDNDVNRSVVGNLLQQEHCEVIEAVNGVEAVDKLSDNVQVVLMDVHMPVLDGIAATRLLLKKRPKLPVVYLTADVTEETKLKCQESGARYILLKPVNKLVLVNTLARVLHDEPPPTVAAAAAASQSSPKPSARFRCLIVDDVNTNRILAAHLARKVFGQESEISFAESGPEAIRFLSERSVDLVLMDIKMPGMSGIEATRRIRALPIPQIRIVGISGFDDDATARECIAAGMDSVLTKPLRENQLRALLLKPPPPVAATPKSSFLFDDTIFRELDENVRRDLLCDWTSNTLEQLAQMKSLCTRQEWKNLGNVAHTLKGSAAQLGAIALSEKAARVDEVVRSGDPPPLSTLSICMEELDASLAATLAHLTKYSFLPRTEGTGIATKKPKGKSKD